MRIRAQQASTFHFYNKVAFKETWANLKSIYSLMQYHNTAPFIKTIYLSLTVSLLL